MFCFAMPCQEYRPTPPQLDAQGQISAVEQWRLPRTTTTLSWADGAIGSLYITVGAGSMSPDTISELNDKLAGSAYIQQNTRRSHMWDSDTMLYYLEHLEVEVRKRRIALGLSVKDNTALIICDKASVHSCKKFELYRKLWQDRNNCILLHGSSTDMVQIPGGFGAAGGPNESWIYIYIYKSRNPVYIYILVCVCI